MCLRADFLRESTLLYRVKRCLISFIEIQVLQLIYGLVVLIFLHYLSFWPLLKILLIVLLELLLLVLFFILLIGAAGIRAQSRRLRIGSTPIEGQALEAG